MQVPPCVAAGVVCHLAGELGGGEVVSLKGQLVVPDFGVFDPAVVEHLYAGAVGQEEGLPLIAASGIAVGFPEVTGFILGNLLDVFFRPHVGVSFCPVEEFRHTVPDVG